MVASAHLYGNISLYGASGAVYSQLLAQQKPSKAITFNAVQSIIDTVTSRIGETKPRPYYLTSGGNWKSQRKAKHLNKFTEGNFYETKTYDTGLKSFRDSAISGDGFMFVFARGEKIVHERVMGSEIWVDEVEAQYGFPRNMHRLKVVDRDELCAYFPDRKKVILDANKTSDGRGSVSNISDMVTVAESWHLAAPDADGEMMGGKHAITLISGEKMLVEPEDWPYDFFPIARVPWCERPIGYWSQGLAEQLQGEQLELNKELQLIQRSMHLAGSLKVFLRNGSKIVKEHINNEIGAIVSHTGEPPVFFCPEPIHAVYFENVNRIIERMYRRAGVSELTAASRKPEGLDSGKAIREFEDIESDRFRTITRQNDNLYLAVAALDVCMAQEMRKAGKAPRVRVPGKYSFDEVDFKRDIGDLDGTEYVMQCFPVSRLPRDPSGRLATIQEYIQAGFITPRQGRRALDFPDLDTIESLANAQEELLTKVLDDICDGENPQEDYQPPEPTDDLSLAKELVLEYIQRGRLLDLEPERLDLLRQWSTQVDALQSRAMAAMGPPPGAPGAEGQPQAAPMPPPQSDLIPNAPGAPGTIQ